MDEREKNLRLRNGTLPIIIAGDMAENSVKFTMVFAEKTGDYKAPAPRNVKIIIHNTKNFKPLKECGTPPHFIWPKYYGGPLATRKEDP